MIRVSKLSYRYPESSVSTLSDINFAVNDGEIVVLVGRNGSGKSTLGRLVAGISNLQSGTVDVDGDIYDRRSKGIRSDLSIIFQNPENQLLFNDFDEEIKFAFRQDTPGLSPELELRVQRALAEVGMSEFRHRDISELSLGQKQRLVIAEALVRGSHNLILDEPTTMIDSEGKHEITKIVRKLRKSGRAILYITNLADEILLADRVLILADGKIAAEVKRAELLEKSQLLRRYHIELPTTLRLLASLRRRGIELPPDALEIPQLVQEIEAKLS